MISPLARNQLEMALRNNGYHTASELPDDWVCADATFASGRCFITHAPTQQDVVIGTSLHHVGRALSEEGIGHPYGASLPLGAEIAVVVPIEAMHATVRRIYELSRSLPNAPLERFHDRARTLPTATEAERLVVQRIGQDIFRDALMDLWSGRCAVTGMDQPELLRASHMKPWAKCNNDAERLDPMNGLLLSAQWDLAFDAGLVTFDDDGSLRLSGRLTPLGKALLAPDASPMLRLSCLKAGHLPYPKHHREYVWQA